MDVKRLRRLLAVGMVVLPVPGWAEDARGIEEVLVTGRRLPPAASELVLATAVIDRDTLSRAGNRRLDRPHAAVSHRLSSLATHHRATASARSSQSAVGRSATAMRTLYRPVVES